MRKIYRTNNLAGKYRKLSVSYNTQQTALAYANRVFLALNEPSNTQFEYTITSGMLPTFTGDTPYSCTYNSMFTLAGGNSDTVNSKALNIRVYKNDVLNTSILSTTIPASSRWTARIYNLTNLTVGDKISFRLWGSTALWYGFYSMCLHPVQIKLSRETKLLKNLQINYATHPVINAGSGYGDSPVVQSIGYNRIQTSGEGDKTLDYTANTPTIDLFYPSETYNLCRPQYGDVSTSYSVVTHTGSLPYYIQNYVPTSITCTEINMNGLHY